MRKTIGDIVKGKPLVAVVPATTVREAARRMTDEKIGAVAVLERDEFIGLFTERDLMRRVVAAGLDPDSTSVASVMTHEVATAAHDESIQSGLEKMHVVKCRHLPVMKAGKLVGMISLRDLIQVDRERVVDRATLLTELVTHKPDYES